MLVKEGEDATTTTVGGSDEAVGARGGDGTTLAAFTGVGAEAGEGVVMRGRRGEEAMMIRGGGVDVERRGGVGRNRVRSGAIPIQEGIGGVGGGVGIVGRLGLQGEWIRRG